MSLRHWFASHTSDRRGRLAFVLLLLVSFCSTGLTPLASLPALSSLTSVAQAAPISACEAQVFDGTYPDPAGTITALRRQPFGATVATTPTLSVVGNTILLQAGQVTLPQLKSALDLYATQLYTVPTQIAQISDLLQETAPNVWLLRSNLQIVRQAALSVVGAGAGTPMTLRLESTDTISPGLEIRNWGYLRFENAKLSSWDPTKNTPDENYLNGRAYVVSFEGGRMDFYSSEVSYLGWKDGEASGIAWRKCYDDNNQATAATGDIHDSNIHNNLFGMYSYEAFGIWAKNNQMHDNEYYGFDPHDYSDFFIFEDNQVFNNGKHGIIFSRWCDYNIIRNNNVHDNAPKPGHTNTIAHGIFLDRRSNYNQIINNTVYNVMDGIAIFQSQYNIIKGNIVHDNLSGIRINSTPVAPENGIPDRTPDQKSMFNQIIDNQISANRDYGVYLYNRADNTTISGNTITGNGRRDSQPGIAFGSGIHIKTGGNLIGPNNIITNNGHGVSLLAVDSNPDVPGDGETNTLQSAPVTAAVDPGLPEGSGNTVKGNTVTGSKGRGIRMVDANTNIVQNNEVATSGDEGVYSDGGSSNQFLGNYVHNNGAPTGSSSDEGIADIGNYGMNIKGLTAQRNFMSKNLLTGNGRAAIKLGSGTNNDIAAPEITAIQPDNIIGKALPNAYVEVFRDPKVGCGAAQCGDEAKVFVGAVKANPATGDWELAATTEGSSFYTASQTDTLSNTSELSSQELAPTITVGPGRKGELTIYADGTGTTLNLAQAKIGLDAYATAINKPEYKDLLTDDGVVNNLRTWTLHASLFVSPTVSLTVKGSSVVPEAQRVDWLRLFSNPGPNPTPNPNDPDHPIYDATKFATIKTYNGNLYFEDTKVTSWDTTANKLDEDKHDGRAFVLAKYDAEMNIIRSEMSYLGYADGEAYGVSWRDVNSTADPVDAPRRTRVTGQVIGSILSHNYYGIYTFQAQDMVFRNNKMFSNIQYGFDPHDFTHDVIVEGNEAYDNGSHGFIISRGCSNFVFRNNISRDNKVVAGSKNPSAHGFMLDPGADPLKAGVPQAPSVFNLFENNQAYGNDGYGVRVYGSNDNTIRNNLFFNNRAGITLENNSTRNSIVGNTITNNHGEAVVDATTGATTTKGGYGVYAFQGADENIIDTNIITGNINTGIYLKTARNVVTNNTITNNQGDGIGTLLETGSDLPPDPPELSAVEGAALVPGAYIADQEPGTWSIAAATIPNNNTISGNTVQQNVDGGIAIKGASGTTLEDNIVTQNSSDGIYIANGSTDTLVRTNTVNGNQSYGIKANGAGVIRNEITQNVVSGNVSGGIAVTGGANGGIIIPKMVIISTNANTQGQNNAIANSWIISGTAAPGMLIELFSDPGQQAARYLGSIKANVNGMFIFTTNGSPQGVSITATATDGVGNTSSLSRPAKPVNSPYPDGDYLVYLPLIAKK